jgi:predicted cupin superfamily sugar epimerase
MLRPESFSAIHRLKSDEIFHFYLGDPVTMLQLHPDRSSLAVTLGQDIASGQKLQLVVPRGVWQGTFLNDGGRFALMGTTVSPGFEYSDFELGTRDELAELFPDRREMISRLTRS